MFDRWEYTIPANTTEANAVKRECKVTRGVLTDLLIYFPPGCHNLARCRIFLGEKAIAPRDESNFIAADGMAIPIRYFNEPIKEDLPVLNWHCWNLDDTFDHTIWMSAQWIGLDEPYEAKMYQELKNLALLLKRMMRV